MPPLSDSEGGGIYALHSTEKSFIIKHMKTFLVAILFFALGIGSFYAWNEYQKVKVENMELKKQVTVSVTPAPTESTPEIDDLMVTSTQTNDAAPGQTSMGAAEGTLGYPSEGIPPLVVYAINTEDKSKYYFTETSQNESKFTIENIKPGIYHFVAYQKANATNSGGYSQAVLCGLLASCKDHSLIPVAITSGKMKSGIQIKDWYADAGDFPTKPN
ncbi:MAG: hypothetical protein RI947_910 [Candidatus Parcubacteria bacterium]|jgi:hypothetical protein